MVPLSVFDTTILLAMSCLSDRDLWIWTWAFCRYHLGGILPHRMNTLFVRLFGFLRLSHIHTFAERRFLIRGVVIVFHEFCSDGDIVFRTTQATLFVHARDLEYSSAGFSWRFRNLTDTCSRTKCFPTLGLFLHLERAQFGLAVHIYFYLI